MSILKETVSFDLVVKDNLLYTDSYVDLVIIDIRDITNAHEVGRIEGLFNQYNSYGFYAQDDLGVVTDWKEVKTVSITKSDCKNGDNFYPWGTYYEGGISFNDFSSMNTTTAVSQKPFVCNRSGRITTVQPGIPENPLPGEKQYIDH